MYTSVCTRVYLIPARPYVPARYSTSFFMKRLQWLIVSEQFFIKLRYLPARGQKREFYMEDRARVCVPEYYFSGYYRAKFTNY